MKEKIMKKKIIEKKQTNKGFFFNNKYTIYDFIKDIVIVAIIVIFIKQFLFGIFQINGQSMADGYYDKEYVVLDSLSYTNFPFFGMIDKHERGDVVIFTPHSVEGKEYFIKRIIGLGGDSIKIEDGKVYLKKKGEINFNLLDESNFLNKENNGKTYVNDTRLFFESSKKAEKNIFEIPENFFFLMGDNRNNSSDSRTCFLNSCYKGIHSNFIQKEDILGKVIFDLGYFNLSTFSFYNEKLKIKTFPKFFDIK